MNASARLRLHGHPVSNYFDAAYAALIEKGVSFELVDVLASQTPEFLALNPLGKIPVLETPSGYLAETIAILEYLEDTVAAPRLYPQDAWLRARARQINNVVQCYIEAPARTLYSGVFMGGTNSAAAIEVARPTMERGARALAGLIELRPWFVGSDFSYADLFSFYCLNVVDRLTRAVYDWSIVDGISGLRAWFERVAGRESSRVVLERFDATFAAYLAAKGASYRESVHGTRGGHAP